MKLFRNQTAKSAVSVLATIATLVSTLAPVSASPAQAESTARSMILKLVAVGYTPTPITINTLNGGSTTDHYLRVEPGLDYAVTVGGDSDALNIDLIVYDEFGQEVLRDYRLDKNAGITFRSTYSGQVKVTIIMRQARTIGSYCLIQSSRPGLRLNMPDSKAP